MFNNADPFPILRVRKLSENATIPQRASVWAAGFDLCASNKDEIIINPRGKALIPTDIAVAIPSACYGRIAPRSGLAVKHAIDVGAGVIDRDYRGEVKVLLFNHSDDAFRVCKGDRIAQLIIERHEIPQVIECEQLDDTERGANGFGSTGQSYNPRKEQKTTNSS